MNDFPTNTPNNDPWNPQNAGSPEGSGQPPANPYGQPAQPQQPAADPYGQPSANPYSQPAQPQQPAADPYGQPSANPYGQPAQPYGQPMPQEPYAQPTYGQQAYAQPYGGATLTPWIKRVGSHIIDILPMAILQRIAEPMMGTSKYDFETGELIDIAGTNPTMGWILTVLAWAWFFYNMVWRDGKTGVSVGRQVVGTKLVSEATGQPIGPLKAFLRQLAHLVDAIICMVGFLFPLWDAKRQTIADKIVNTLVINTK
ncbi:MULTISPECIES: RDD family protein [unclassified Luteococcus]|uniref:RDD family protein n=1 Tax=unclassified Luteococcus TaxID=2639923 RepID=UPI00313BCD15